MLDAKSSGTLTVDALLARLAATRSGLSQPDADARLQQYGRNEPAATRPTRQIVVLLRIVAQPLSVVLILASIVAFIVGETTDAVLIDLMVIMSAGLDFYQTWKSQRAIDRLRAEVTMTADVLRDGVERTIDRALVVPGDILVLAAGDLVAADAVLLDERDLHVQEAALTGESLPVEKKVATEVVLPLNPVEADNAVFLGTAVVSGSARALVVATGMQTAFGDIARRITEERPETEFERGTKEFGLFIARTVLFLVVFVLLVTVALRRDPLQSLLFAVALAVGLTPEFLPMVVAVTLSQGAVHMSRRKVIVKSLAAIQNLGSIDVLCSDKTGTLTEGRMRVIGSIAADGSDSRQPLELASLNSRFESGIRSPLDAAILEENVPQGDWKKLDEIPFDFERRMLSIAVVRGSERQLISKGACESVLPRCSQFTKGAEVLPITADVRKEIESVFAAHSDAGERLLAVATRGLSGERVSHDDEQQLVLRGFVAFSDPPLAEAADAIAAMRSDGVHVKILTGDNERVARHVCASVGVEVERVITGAEIDRMTDGALGRSAEDVDVFARLAPAQKTRVISALRRRGHVVGFMGDGINDAPSLRAADVGISVSGAVAVARSAADIILLEQSLAVLHAGIIEGRKAFGNVMKYIMMETSSNFGNMFSMAAASMVLPFLPMMPTQILLNNFLYDLAQVTIPSDRVDETYTKKPQRWNIRFVRRFMTVIGPISSLFDFLTFFALLSIFHARAELFHTGWFIESIATQTLVVFIIRTAGSPLRSRPGTALVVASLGVVAVALALPFTPIASALGFVPPPLPYFLFVLGAVALYLTLVQVVKRWFFARFAA